jgi:hypothetical protein
VDEKIVHECSFGRHQAGILDLTIGEMSSVVAGDALHQIERLRAENLDLSHVADVENSSAGADGFVLGKNAGIFEGHIPAAKIDHLGAQAAMGGV